MHISTRGLKESCALRRQLLPQGSLAVITDLARSAPDEYYLGIRDNAINLYYMGGSLLKVGSRGTTFGFNNDYHTDQTNSKKYASITEWFNDLENIKAAVKNHQTVKTKNEKIVQQQILSSNNANHEADYFLVDMEYSVSGFSYGRFDYIAITRKPNAEGKYSIALIELKYGVGAFSTSRKSGAYGSGIVGHANNFNRFIYGKNGKRELLGGKQDPLVHLREEILNIIRNYKDFNLLDRELFTDIAEDKILIDENTIQTLFLCVGCLDVTGAIQKAKKYLGVHPTANAKYTTKNIELNPALNLRWHIAANPTVPAINSANFIEII